MDLNKQYSWLVVGATAVLMVWLVSQGVNLPALHKLVFWFLLLAAVEALPVSLGFGSEVTMGFPIHLAMAILFPPWIAMAIAGLAAVDVREFRREIPLHRALFNRSQLMLAEGASAAMFSFYQQSGGELLSFPEGAIVITGASAAHFLVNLGLVGLSVATLERVRLTQAVRELLPDPVGGFLITYVLLSGLGAATAAVYRQPSGAWAVAAFLIPLVFARLSILGARGQQELSERVRKQQEALLQATERVFADREEERHRIAEEIHDTSLQMLAAASYGCGNAEELIQTGQVDQARSAMTTSRDAINEAMTALRESLVDLRKSTVEEGGLIETVRHWAEQMSTLWGTDVRIDGNIVHEPPIPVALAAFQILQEGLTNALKHAQGALITVRIDDAEGMVRIVVEDEGPGFDPQVEAGEDHLGMRLMKERATRVGGSIAFDSTPGVGTRLEAILPGGLAR
jgi:signal transduction histidine kinase